MRPVTTRTTGVVLLVLLLAGFLLLGALPNQVASIRVAGLSLLWWYGGVLAPVMAVLVAIRWLAEPRARPVSGRMTSVARILAVWLTPVMVLAVPAALAARGADGLWLGLVVTLAPLIALGWGAGRPHPGDGAPGSETLFPGRHAAHHGGRAALGEHRTGGRRDRVARRAPVAGHRGHRGGGLAPDRLAAPAPDRPAAARDRVHGRGRGAAAARVGARARAHRGVGSRGHPARPSGSRPRAPGSSAGAIWAWCGAARRSCFDEVHRLTAPAGGILRARTMDGGRRAAIEWTLAPGQTVTLRAGDEISRASTLRLRFEADKRVPGAPASGMAWADGGPRRGLERVGLAGHAAGRRGRAATRGAHGAALPRRVGLAAGGLLLAFVWAQAWAVYALIQAPDLFLGGITLERLLELPPHALFAEPWRRTLQTLLLAAGLAAFLASSLALRERLGALDATGGGEIGHDPGLWAGSSAGPRSRACGRSIRGR